jgi:hypothetical protein
MKEKKENILKDCLKILSKHYLPDSFVYKVAATALNRLNPVELDALRTMLMSIQ